jgi:hypothetical protein
MIESSVSSTGAEAFSSLPVGIVLKDHLKRGVKPLYNVPLIPLNIGFGIVKVAPEKQLALREAVVSEARKQGGCPITL